ncbi:Crp/Fnr family transcriptional regulator [Rufibacter psychrotolerans]|uniref:Crp/Fnr family transcriptional regulator n=1 Tax=Rufibacter psychrotolerans TaxID=2812556 RepID=UPI001967EF52|nr:cyclic nucleotide-binding domain-containing protein [Rufibacter sp. SYSU D00308]
MNPFLLQLKKYGPLSEEAEHAILRRLRYFQKRKNEHFLKEGQLISSYFMLSKGLIRAYFYRNGKEMNTWFGEEHQIFGSILPIYPNQPSLENIQFLEGSEVCTISTEDLHELYLTYPEMNLIGRKTAGELCVLREERIFSLQTESAAERYHSLLKGQPHVLSRINLGYIAPYPGIPQETLGRKRKP